MKEHIQQLAEEYAKDFENNDEMDTKDFAIIDFTAGINRVLQHPEEFGLQTKEY